MSTVLDQIKRCQYTIEKYPDDEQKLLQSIERLHQLDVTVRHLEETGVGRTVNALRKEPGTIGEASRALVKEWKHMVAAEEKSEPEDYNNDSSHYNGHGSGSVQESNNSHSRERSNYNDQSASNYNHKQINGNKRKYSSEEEQQHTKRSRYSSSEDQSGKSDIAVKEEIDSEHNHSSDNHDTESDMSEYSEEENEEIPKIKKEKDGTSPNKSNFGGKGADKNKSGECSQSHLKENKTDTKYSSDEFKDLDNSPYSYKYKDSEKYNKKQTTGFSHKTEVKDSTEKHQSSSSEKRSKDRDRDDKDKQRHSSEKDKNKSEKSKSHKYDESKYKASSEKEVTSKDKLKSKDSHKSSKDKESSDRDKHKDKSHSSKHKQSHSHKSKDEKKQSSGSDSKSSASESKSKSSSTSESKKKSSSESKSKSSSETKNKSSSSDSNSKSSSSKDKESKHQSSSSSSHRRSSSNKSSSSRSVEPKKKTSHNSDSEDGIDCGSGASFAEALGMISPSKTKKKTVIKDVSSPRSSSSDVGPVNLLAPSTKLAPLPLLEISALPEISPNYRPMPPPKLLPHFTEDDAMSAVISSKNQRTKVYSGNKTVGKVYTLYELCVQVLQEHIDSLEYTGGVPYEILKPIVDRATPEQLFMLEHYNPYLMDDTDHLWQKHCEKRFRNKRREEMETWRDMYLRCQEEQEYKLKSLTANIRMAQEVKNAPVKQTKMAYVDSVVKPPRNIARKQAIHGTARTASASPAARVAALAAGPNVARPGAVRPVPSTPTTSFAALQKPKKAPLMQKALQFMRGRKR